MKPYKLQKILIANAEKIYATDQERAEARKELDRKLNRKNRRILKQTQLTLFNALAIHRD